MRSPLLEFSGSLSPTQSASPTASPSTPPPTRSPTGSPSNNPTSQTPTTAPITPYPTDMPTEIRDQNENCPAWAAAGECQANPNYMLQVCALSCSNANEGGGGEFVIRDPNGVASTRPSPVRVVASLIAGIGGALWLFA